jgi:hypothetical protein
MKSKTAPDMKVIKELKVRLLPDKNMTQNVSNLTSVKELKTMFIKDQELSLEPEHIRFFCLGKEL